MKERNKLIKTVLEQSFGKGKVRTRGHRGTAYGWVTITIDYSPRNWEHRNQIEAMIWKLLAAAKCDVGTFGYDDPGSDYGYGKRAHIYFNDCLDKVEKNRLQMADGSGSAVVRVLSDGTLAI